LEHGLLYTLRKFHFPAWGELKLVLGCPRLDLRNDWFARLVYIGERLLRFPLPPVNVADYPLSGKKVFSLSSCHLDEVTNLDHTLWDCRIETTTELLRKLFPRHVGIKERHWQVFVAGS
jgi:hypothetical protein